LHFRTSAWVSIGTAPNPRAGSQAPAVTSWRSRSRINTRTWLDAEYQSEVPLLRRFHRVGLRPIERLTSTRVRYAVDQARVCAPSSLYTAVLSRNSAARHRLAPLRRQGQQTLPWTMEDSTRLCDRVGFHDSGVQEARLPGTTASIPGELTPRGDPSAGKRTGHAGCLRHTER
jgi:hypothetical protein